MKEYQKIHSLFKRDISGKFTGEFACHEFEFLKECEWVFDEKVDGTNVRVIWNGEKVRFGGRTDNAQIPTRLYDKLSELFPEDAFEDMPNMTLYGEGFGAKIQKGGGNYNPNDVDFVVFDIFIDGWWLLRHSIEEIAERLKIQVVPIIGKGTLCDAVNMTKKGILSRWGDFQAEGVVARPAFPLFNRKGDRIITKLKCKDWI